MNISLNSLLALFVAAIAIVAYDWRSIKDTRTKIAYLVLFGSGFTLAVALLVYPELPGPSDLLRPILAPAAKLLLK
ncbi:hypothetical protein [Paenibacillus sp. MMS18-CY102]|uniref:hypothetical protein n=1 Tax=Paenibacillus sp. MMS18-CY102 TaxID=2682849 RepID=UPI0013662D5E|nr:hypothetical protein [Paenibacillus sp. MMS18-CY102]MWC27246.1 hypothetical protein [Paenibacillus sp. MMS18-CY102]